MQPQMDTDKTSFATEGLVNEGQRAPRNTVPNFILSSNPGKNKKNKRLCDHELHESHKFWKTE
jgi:hypothetical protein